MAIVTRSLTLTQANLDYGHIYLTGCMDIFPPDVMGGANKSVAAPRTVQVDFGSGVVDTDIVGGKRIFRRRSWVREFLTQNDVAAGHRILLEKLEPYAYRVRVEPRKPFMCLSIQQPWADLIMSGKKRVENRNRSWQDAQNRLRAGEQVCLGIHVSTGLSVWDGLSPADRDHYAPGWTPGCSSTYGALIGIVPVVQICRWKELSPELREHIFADRHFDWHWVLGKPLNLSSPFEWSGNASLFKVQVPCRLLPAELR